MPNSYIIYTFSPLNDSMVSRATLLVPGQKFKFTYRDKDNRDKDKVYSFQGLEDINHEEILLNNYNPIESNGSLASMLELNYSLKSMGHVSLYLSPMSKVIFSQNEDNYCLNNSTEEALSILDIPLLINTCKHLNTIFADTETIRINFSNIKFSDIKYFKEYEYINKLFTKGSIDLFAQQNNMSFNTKKVNLFIEDNFLHYLVLLSN